MHRPVSLWLSALFLFAHGCSLPTATERDASSQQDAALGDAQTSDGLLLADGRIDDARVDAPRPDDARSDTRSDSTAIDPGACGSRLDVRVYGGDFNGNTHVVRVPRGVSVVFRADGEVPSTSGNFAEQPLAATVSTGDGVIAAEGLGIRWTASNGAPNNSESTVVVRALGPCQNVSIRPFRIVTVEAAPTLNFTACWSSTNCSNDPSATPGTAQTATAWVVTSESVQLAPTLWFEIDGRQALAHLDASQVDVSQTNAAWTVGPALSLMAGPAESSVTVALRGTSLSRTRLLHALAGEPTELVLRSSLPQIDVDARVLIRAERVWNIAGSRVQAEAPTAIFSVARGTAFTLENVPSRVGAALAVWRAGGVGVVMASAAGLTASLALPAGFRNATLSITPRSVTLRRSADVPRMCQPLQVSIAGAGLTSRALTPEEMRHVQCSDAALPRVFVNDEGPALCDATDPSVINRPVSCSFVNVRGSVLVTLQ